MLTTFFDSSINKTDFQLFVNEELILKSKIINVKKMWYKSIFNDTEEKSFDTYLKPYLLIYLYIYVTSYFPYTYLFQLIFSSGSKTLLNCI